jgi:hypothetical protein
MLVNPQWFQTICALLQVGGGGDDDGVCHHFLILFKLN